MAQGISIKGQDTIASWDAPYKGVLRDMPIQKLPEDCLYDCSNVLYRSGALQVRPGLQKFTTNDLGARVTGAIQNSTLASGVFDPTAFQNDTFQESGNTAGSVIVAGTNRKIWVYFSGSWHDLTNTALTATDTYLAQFTSIQIGTTVFTLMTNGVDTPRSWDNQSATVTNVAGTPPLFTDWTTSSDRVIGVVPPYLVQWGNALNIGTWPANNFRVLSDTPDSVVAVENLGTLGVAVYKKNSLWVGIAQGGLDSSYFRFELRGQYEGPANPNCLVNVNGSHYYMTQSGRVGVFDGVRQTWINDPVLPLLRQTIDQTNMARAFMVYNPTDREVWCYYPRLAEAGTGNVTGLLIIALPKQFSYEGIFFHAGYFGQTAIPVTAGVDRRLDVGDYLTFGQNSGQNLAYGYQDMMTDDGVGFSGFWQTPFKGAGKWDVHQPSGVETYARRIGGAGSLTMKVVSTYMIGSTSNFSQGTALDLTTEPIHANAMNFGVNGRFFGLRYEFVAPINLQWYGSRLMGARQE